MYDFSTGQYDPYKNKKIRSAHAIINGETKKVSLQYVDCITANDDESELYISNVPTGITVLSPHYGLEEFVDDIKVAEQQEK
jgi:aspartate ammonia-lyase